MTPPTIDHDEPALVPATDPTFREQQIAYWRREAEANYRLGFMDLARRCSTFAADWEFGQEAAP